MKSTLLILITFVVAAMSINEKYIQKSMSALGVNREEIITCANQANITDEDIQYIDEIVQQNSQITNFDDKAIRMGCYYTCLAQKNGLMTDTNVKADEIQKLPTLLIKSQIRPGQSLATLLQKADTCADQVTDETDKCKILLKFMLCLKS